MINDFFSRVNLREANEKRRAARAPDACGVIMDCGHDIFHQMNKFTNH
jgi:hypothetical protein